MKNNTLLIIGNGFDLHLHIESKFSQFFEKNELPAIEKFVNSNETKYSDDINLISLILFNTFYHHKINYQGNAAMYSSEEVMKTFRNVFNYDEKIDLWMDVENYLFKFLNSTALDYIRNAYNKIVFENSYVNYVIHRYDFIRYFLLAIRCNNRYPNKISFDDFLMEELHLFEKRFVEYIKKQIESVSYSTIAKSLLEKMINHTMSGTIINFNYTHIPCNRQFKEINVHGSIDDEIIIGIDAQQELKSLSIPFTKTFRKLTSKDNQTTINEIIDEIIIYGHSLGKQDYSYFQAVFDYTNLYSSKTRIRFIYSDDFIEIQEREHHKKHMADSLFKLINEYGNTFDNKNHGKNLLHKLMLEGRLKMEINNFEDADVNGANNKPQ